MLLSGSRTSTSVLHGLPELGSQVHVSDKLIAKCICTAVTNDVSMEVQFWWRCFGNPNRNTLVQSKSFCCLKKERKKVKTKKKRKEKKIDLFHALPEVWSLYLGKPAATAAALASLTIRQLYANTLRLPVVKQQSFPTPLRF